MAFGFERIACHNGHAETVYARPDSVPDPVSCAAVEVAVYFLAENEIVPPEALATDSIRVAVVDRVRYAGVGAEEDSWPVLVVTIDLLSRENNLLATLGGDEEYGWAPEGLRY